MCVRMPKSLRRPKLRPVIGSASPRLRFSGQDAADFTQHPQDPSAPPQEMPDRTPYKSRAASAGRMQRIQGPFRSKEQIEVANAKAANTFRSVQSSAPYSTVTEDKAMQERLAKLTRVAPKDFLMPSSAAKPPP